MITWKDVFNSNKLKYRDYYKCADFVKTTGYKYMAFNGYVYAVYDKKMLALFHIHNLDKDELDGIFLQNSKRKTSGLFESGYVR